MKNLIGRVLTSLLLGVLTLGSIAHAQGAERVIKVNIPFDFTAGNYLLPAGRYSLKRTEPWLLELRDSEGRFLANALTQSVQTLTGPDQPKLRFDHVGGQYILTQVWQESDSLGQQILRPRSAILAVRRPSRHVQTAEVGNPR